MKLKNKGILYIVYRFGNEFPKAISYKKESKEPIFIGYSGADNFGKLPEPG